MIATVWDDIVTRLKGAGWTLDKSEGDSIRDGLVTIKLPEMIRDDQVSSFTRERVARRVLLRLQFRDNKTAYMQKKIAEDVEKVIVAMRNSYYLFERQMLEEGPDGFIAEIEYTVRDSVN